ncbi:MAG TPA: GNAT family N-acetyltransferase, partial [Clostridia bacterium]|nr:GNAT family N-acetyltransferase [Clostridia bacterium]
LEQNEAFAKEKELQDGWKVPTAQFWLYVDGRPVGIGRIRHFLTDKLRQEGGQVGYAIRPGERNKGYGTLLLGELIKEARKMKIPEVLLTVHNGNEYSKKVALANHGVIEKVSSERHYIRIPC